MTDTNQGYSTFTVDEVKNRVRTIINTADSEVEVRVRIVQELGYPHGIDGMVVNFRCKGEAMIMVWGPNREVVNI